MRDQDTTRLRDCTLELVAARRRLAAGPTAAEATALRARIKALSAAILDLSLLATADAAHETGHFDDETMLRATIARNRKDRKMMTYDRMGPLPGTAELRRGAADDNGASTGGAKVLIQRLPRTAACYTVESIGNGEAGLFEWTLPAAKSDEGGRNFRGNTRETSVSGTAAEAVFSAMEGGADRAGTIYDRARQYERTSAAPRWRQSSMARASDEAVQRRAIHNRNVLNRKKYGYDGGPGAA
jgi:hypothetical protein